MTEPGAWELVLHHRYGDGSARDLSGHGNDGVAPGRHGRGRSGEAGALVLDGERDRVFVIPSPSLVRPGAIRAELIVNVDELGHRRTLVEGYLSFALFVEGDGSIGGSIFRYRDWHGVRSRAGVIEPGTWCIAAFTYTADGVMTVSVDGTTVAEAVRAVGPADGVSWPFGLSVGAWPDADQRVLKGRIEEVRLWRGVPGG